MNAKNRLTIFLMFFTTYLNELLLIRSFSEQPINANQASEVSTSWGLTGCLSLTTCGWWELPPDHLLFSKTHLTLKKWSFQCEFEWNWPQHAWSWVVMTRSGLYWIRMKYKKKFNTWKLSKKCKLEFQFCILFAT